MITRLIYCEKNNNVKIVSFANGNGFRANIAELGLAVADNLTIISSTLENRISVIHNNKVIEIGYEMAAKIFVETESIVSLPLSKLRIEDKAIVVSVKSKGEVRRRIMDMGIVKGTELQVTRKAPLGDPIELTINNFNLSLRLSEAGTIIVKPIND